MARTVNPQAHAAKRNEILDAAQRLVYTKGYERMTLQDIREELQISSGAFYHYFDSKPAVLEAFIERIRQEVEQPLLPIVRDPHLPALTKLQSFFDTIDRLRVAHKVDVIALGRIWYTDENAIVRQKVDQAIHDQRAPLIAEIVRQGVVEGVFNTLFPDQAGDIILSLIHGMANIHARMLLSIGKDDDDQHRVESVVTTHAAYMDAVERVIGAPAQSLYRIDPDAVHMWVVTARANQPQI